MQTMTKSNTEANLAPRFATNENVARTMSLNLGGVKIKQDLDGRYCLNDLHKASGKEKRHAPGYWLSIQQAAELIAELETTGIPVVTVEGRNGGTYVMKELVYAYAMWVSAKFHLHVIRTFDAVIVGHLEIVESRQARERARLDAPHLTNAIKIQRLANGKELAPHVFSNEFDLINRTVLGMSSKQFRAAHGMSANEPIRDSLTPCQIRAIEHMQRLNSSLIDIGLPFDQRKGKLCQVFVLQHQRALISETLRIEA